MPEADNAKGTSFLHYHYKTPGFWEVLHPVCAPGEVIGASQDLQNKGASRILLSTKFLPRFWGLE